MRLHLHRWVVAAASEWRRSVGTQDLTDSKDGRPVTLVLHRCTHCSKTRTEELPGHWPLAALTGIHHVNTGEPTS